jgi:hypothetical protein
LRNQPINPPILRRGIPFDAMVVGLLLVGFFVVAAVMPAQNDTFWHLRAGADIWRTGHVPRVDGYSHTFPGAPWPDHEWLSQVLMYGAYRLGGMPALALACALCVWGSIAIGYRLMVGRPAARIAPLVLGLLIGCCVWALRPQVLTLLLLAVLSWLLVHERLRVIPPLFLLWANAHGGVVLGGLVLSGAWVAAAARWALRREADDARRLRTLSIVLPLAGLATAATPMGFGIYRFVLESTERSYAVKITEWFPPWPVDFLGVVFWASGLAFAGALVARRRALAGADWPTFALLGGALALAPLAFRSWRNVGPFVALAIPAASRVLGPDFRIRLRRAARPASPDHPLVNLGLLSAFGLIGICFVAIAWSLPLKLMGWRPIPVEGLRAVEACRGPLYNQYNEGGHLIWFTPDRPVFVDGRQDPYPIAFLLEAGEVEHQRKPYRPLFERWGIRCAFLPATSPTVAALGAAGWQRRFGDADWTVYEAPARQGPGAD